MTTVSDLVNLPSNHCAIIIQGVVNWKTSKQVTSFYTSLVMRHPPTNASFVTTATHTAVISDHKRISHNIAMYCIVIKIVLCS